MAKEASSFRTFNFILVILYVVPSSESTECMFPGIQSNGYTEPFQGTYAVGEIANFFCFDNYVIVGQANLTCQGSDIWDAEIPVCVKVCPEISFPDTRLISQNVTLDYINVIDDVLVWGCKNGYSLDPGQAEEQTVIVCQPGGWFTQSVITCSKISCPDPGIPIGVERTGDSFLFDDVIIFSCSIMGNVISSGSSSRICQSNGTWSGSNPTCTDPPPTTNVITTTDFIETTNQQTTNVITTTDFIETTMIFAQTVSPSMPATTPETIDIESFTRGVFSSTNTVSPSMPATDTESSSLSQSIIYVVALIGGSFVFVFLIGSAICIFTSKPRKRRRKSNELQKTDWVHESGDGAESDPVYEAPPYSNDKKQTEPLKPEHIGLSLAKNDSVRSEASYLTPDDFISHDYQNVPEVLTRL